MKQILSFTLNGMPVEALAKPTDTLLDILREQIGVEGPKRGCDSGDCGACMVLLDGQTVNACLVIALTVTGREVTTVEGLGHPAKLHPLQEAFHEHGASQCGFCSSGMIISAKALLDRKPRPTRDEIVEALSGNLCRCGSYLEVIEAIEAVSAGERKEKQP
jgi:aerobic carbon-monoxide dehydrogenase small subunit